MRITKAQQELIGFNISESIEDIEGTFNNYKVFKIKDMELRKMGYKYNIYKVFSNSDIEFVENIKNKKEIELYYYS